MCSNRDTGRANGSRDGDWAWKTTTDHRNAESSQRASRLKSAGACLLVGLVQFLSGMLPVLKFQIENEVALSLQSLCTGEVNVTEPNLFSGKRKRRCGAGVDAIVEVKR